MKSGALLHLAAVLLDKALAALAESLDGRRGPPVLQIAHLVVLTSLIVQAVGELVADDHADGAVVDGKRAGSVKEGRLEDARGNG